MKIAGRNVAALVMILCLVFIAACTPAPGEVTSAPTPAPEETTPTSTPEEVTPPPTPEPAPTPTQPATAPNPKPEGNFRLLISDDANAIGDFASLIVTISSVGVHKAGENGGWLEVSLAEEEELDLVSLQGENAEEIWSGNFTAGQYTNVFIYVSDIDAELNNGDSTEVKLPSDKLHINTNFSIPEDSPVSFVFDISVVATGNDKNGVSYIIKPVISQSGPNQKFTEVKSRERERDRERESLDLELEGDIAPGETVTLLVTFNGEPVVGATVEVNGEEIGETGDDGTISFTIPDDAGELEIEVKRGEQEGELEFEFEKELEGELTLEIVEGDVASGETVTLLVTFEGDPIEGAKVKVDGGNVGETGDDGTISFTIPDDVTDLEVEAKLGGREGEMNIAVSR
ncbi:MAG TPA: DUF4382 domain-containing protein [Dehalococcoidales bacterium]|nr:DUF4382 domain-containing protein [Dehalococcoidales bacterium]